MEPKDPLLQALPTGEQPLVVSPVSAGPVVVDAFAGRVHVDWDNSARVTAYGQMPFFIDFVICRARHMTNYAARQTMPSGSWRNSGCRGAVVQRGHVVSAPFGIVFC
jgi:hypothetical protein